MKTLGISGSPRKNHTTDKLVKEVLSTVGGETEFISLKGKKISPCMACLGCVRTNSCVIKDDGTEILEKMLESDAVVVGAPNYYGGANALTRALLERTYSFRHRDAMKLAGKPYVTVGTGNAPEDMKRFFNASAMNHVGSVAAQGVQGCFTCGFGETCKVGAVHAMFGEGYKITEESMPTLEKQPEVIMKAHDLGKKLSKSTKG